MDSWNFTGFRWPSLGYDSWAWDLKRALSRLLISSTPPLPRPLVENLFYPHIKFLPFLHKMSSVTSIEFLFFFWHLHHRLLRIMWLPECIVSFSSICWSVQVCCPGWCWFYFLLFYWKDLVARLRECFCFDVAQFHYLKYLVRFALMLINEHLPIDLLIGSEFLSSLPTTVYSCCWHLEPRMHIRRNDDWRTSISWEKCCTSVGSYHWYARHTSFRNHCSGTLLSLVCLVLSMILSSQILQSHSIHL